MIKPSKGATEALKSIGLSTKDFTDKNGNMKSMSDIFKELNEHTKNLSKQEKGALFKAIFGATGESAAIILSDSASEMKSLISRLKSPIKGKGMFNVWLIKIWAPLRWRLLNLRNLEKRRR